MSCIAGIVLIVCFAMLVSIFEDRGAIYRAHRRAARAEARTDRLRDAYMQLWREYHTQQQRQQEASPDAL